MSQAEYAYGIKIHFIFVYQSSFIVEAFDEIADQVTDPKDNEQTSLGGGGVWLLMYV